MKEFRKASVSILIIVVLGYFAISWATFQVRNPTANRMVFYTHFLDVVGFKKLPQFQEERK
jgi:hypothetical protein